MEGRKNVDVTVVLTLSVDEAKDIVDWAQHPKHDETDHETQLRLGLHRAVYDALQDDA